MKVVTYLAPVDEPHILAMGARSLLECTVAQNQIMMRANPGAFPPLYQSKVRFRPEPNAGEYEEFATADLVLRRGYGDCDDLVAYRVAELREQGEDATIRIHWRDKGATTGRLYHVTVRRGKTRKFPDGEIEDPSRFLGM